MSNKFKAKLSGAEYDALESDVLKGFYTKAGDGNYVANLEGAETEDAILGLKNAKNHEKQEAEKYKNELAGIRQLLGDAKPEDIQKIISDAAAAKEEALKVAGKWDEMKTQMRQEFENKELKPLQDQAAKYKTATEKYLIDSEFRKAVETLKPFEGAADALLPHIKPHVKLVEENGELKPRIFDGDTLQVNAKGEPMSFTEYADKTYRQSPVYGRFFQADETAGSGSPAFSGGGSNNVTTVSAKDQNALSANIDKIASGEMRVIG